MADLTLPERDPIPNPLGWIPIALAGWLVLFGGYEALERTLLVDASPELLHALHILRGTVTSFLLAGLVAWSILRKRPAAAPSAMGGLRAILSRTQAEELRVQAAWIIRLRWLAILGVLATTFLCHFTLGVISADSTLALALIAGGMTVANARFATMSPQQLSGLRIAFTQVFLDLVALTLMLHFAGGLRNPFFVFYLFHIVIAGILLGRGETYVVAGLAVALFSGMVLLQGAGLVRDYPLLLPGASPPLRERWIELAGVLAAFAGAAGCTAYFSTTIMSKLRARNAEVLDASLLVAQERMKMEDIVRSVGAALLVLDPQDRVLWANDTAREWFGDGLVGLPCHERVWRNESPCGPCPRAGATPAAVERSLLLGGRKRHFLVSCSPIQGADGQVDQVLSLIQDVTRAKEVELNLLQTDKMAAVGQLAAGIAHEINNPLAVVASSTEILAEFLAAGDAPREAIERHLKRIEENVFRCKETVDNLLAFARQGDDGFEEVDVRTLLDSTIDLVEASARAKGRRVVRAYAETAAVEAALRLARSRGWRIQQVVLNLVLNALDATVDGGTVTVAAQSEGDGVQISVEDDGGGIPPEDLGRLFEPFFTTKGVGKGTGLGLHLSHRIVESLHGRIGVESPPGKGALFRVWLPSDTSVGAVAGEVRP